MQTAGATARGKGIYTGEAKGKVHVEVHLPIRCEDVPLKSSFFPFCIAVVLVINYGRSVGETTAGNRSSDFNYTLCHFPVI